MDESPAVADKVSDLKIAEKPSSATPEPVQAPASDATQSATPAPSHRMPPSATVTVSVPCSGAQCTNAAPNHLICPTCQKQGLPRAPFCSQECLKKNWSEHKKVHRSKTQSSNNAALDPNSPNFDPFTWYPYTGSLRACYPKEPLPKRIIPSHIRKPDYADHDRGVSNAERSAYAQRNIKILDKEGIAGMRKVCKLSREVLDIAAAAIKPGVTTQQLDDICFQACMERDAYPSPLNYANFPKSFCTSVNEVICHGIPDERPLQEGDIINLDVSLYHGGYHGDLNETYAVGQIDKDSQRLIDTTKKSLQAAIDICKPGTLFRDIGKQIEPVCTKGGCTVNRRYTGHGSRELFHCAPTIPHYANNKAPFSMKAGMTFTIEPMVNLGQAADSHWPDNWTAVTMDGQRSAQFEEMLLVTEDGVEILTGGGNSKFHGHGTPLPQ